MAGKEPLACRPAGTAQPPALLRRHPCDTEEMDFDYCSEI